MPFGSRRNDALAGVVPVHADLPDMGAVVEHHDDERQRLIL
ncbi:hypothetical protein [Saccharopolyspora phatthalungensis]|uniref:Uncharacterized protein n=1 Tax=Saccharopolyspora phatthalungensis TaxID=664693 RepID=A0A840PT69_9PSEU|nr:hypothetical protein [Saccharopolyspora phatthalungensis]MBB5153482.1 hypothetical protein [Saccharopolyspora phatthalungensis]